MKSVLSLAMSGTSIPLLMDAILFLLSVGSKIPDGMNGSGKGINEFRMASQGEDFNESESQHQD